MDEAQTQTSWVSVKAQLILIKNVLNENPIIILNNYLYIIRARSSFQNISSNLYIHKIEAQVGQMWRYTNTKDYCFNEWYLSLYLICWGHNKHKELVLISHQSHRESCSLSRSKSTPFTHSITVVTATQFKRGFLRPEIKNDEKKRGRYSRNTNTFMRTPKMWTRS